MWQSFCCYFVDATKWIDYNNKKTEKTYVYYTIDVKKGNWLNIELDLFSLDFVIYLMKVSLSYAFGSKTYKAAQASIDKREGSLVKTSYLIENLIGNYNVIKIYGWLTDNGLKYLGAKNNNKNYVLSGIPST